MRKHLNLAEYWCKSPPLLFAYIVFAVLAFGYFQSTKSTEYTQGTIIDTITEEKGGIVEKRYILVKFKDGKEFLIELPAQEFAKLGETVLIAIPKNDKSSPYKFVRYVD